MEGYFVQKYENIKTKDDLLIDTPCCYNCKHAKRFYDKETNEFYIRCYEDPTIVYIIDFFGFCTCFAENGLNIKSILIEPEKRRIQMNFKMSMDNNANAVIKIKIYELIEELKSTVLQNFKIENKYYFIDSIFEELVKKDSGKSLLEEVFEKAAENIVRRGNK